MMSSLRLAVEVASHARDATAVRSSSFEGIYDDATPPLEGSSSESTTDVTPCDVGDRFAPARVEEEEAGALARVSSFEGLYGDGAFGKEAAHVEEKDVDELGATTDSDLDRLVSKHSFCCLRLCFLCVFLCLPDAKFLRKKR